MGVTHFYHFARGVEYGGAFLVMVDAAPARLLCRLPVQVEREPIDNQTRILAPSGYVDYVSYKQTNGQSSPFTFLD